MTKAKQNFEPQPEKQPRKSTQKSTQKNTQKSTPKTTEGNSRKIDSHDPCVHDPNAIQSTASAGAEASSKVSASQSQVLPSAAAAAAAAAPDLQQPQYYFNRELSWLEFNRRVLAEGMDERTPLLERAKFLSIFSTNLDEFFMVRVAGLKQQVVAEVRKRSPDGRTPEQQLQDISQRLLPLVQEQHRYFGRSLRPELQRNGIHLLDYEALTPKQRLYLQTYYEERIFPVLTPLAVDPGHPFPMISNLSLNLAVVVQETETAEEHFARIKVPKVLPRFIALPEALYPSPAAPSPGNRAGEQEIAWMGVALEQVIAENLETLFPGMEVLECHPFRVTRNSDLDLEEDEADDLMLAIEEELRRRRLGGSAVRLEILSTMPEGIGDRLMQELALGPEDVYALEGILGLNDLIIFLGLPLPELKDIPWTPVTPEVFQSHGEPVGNLEGEERIDLFGLLKKQDVMLHHPYESFSATVQRFITQAAYDDNVLAIKMTLYRTSGDSPIVQALIKAAENGKQVVVLVELKARFDEANNISWARKLEAAGVHVVYGLVGLKTHTKITLVVRNEGDKIRRYVHIGTGNYNPKTARLYTDLGILSARDELGADLTDLFNYLTGYSRQQSYRRLLVAPVNLRSRMLALIQRETDYAQAGGEGRIVAKMNALVDPELIRALYRASQAGVSVDLIVRGVCCLRPGVAGVSDRIRVISIIGRLLEHSRIFYFHNAGEGEVFLGSADWMPRNLNRRVEAVVQVQSPKLVADLQEILAVMLADNRYCWELQADGSSRQRQPAANERVRSAQLKLMEMALHQGEH